MPKLTKDPKTPPVISLSDIQKLADLGTKEALEKLKALSEQDLSDDIGPYVRIALEECEFNYYAPTNSDDERDLDMAIMIRERERSIERMEDKQEEDKEKEAEYQIDLGIHEKILKSNLKRHKDWEAFAPILLGGDSMSKEIDAEFLQYQREWVKEARKLIKNDKYKDAPAEYLDGFDLPDFDEECTCSDCLAESGCCDAGCGCGEK